MKTTTVLHYESLYNINQAFGEILQQLGQMKEAGFLTANFLDYEIAVMKERRAGVNYNITEKLRSIEVEDWKVFEDARLKHDQKRKEEAEGPQPPKRKHK